MTTSGVSRGPAVSLEALQRGRAVNELGSEANKAFMTHKKEIRGWNSKHLEISSPLLLMFSRCIPRIEE